MTRRRYSYDCDLGMRREAEGEQKIHQNLENQAAEFRTEEPDSLDTLPAEATDELSSQPTAETDPPTDPFKKID